MKPNNIPIAVIFFVFGFIFLLWFSAGKQADAQTEASRKEISPNDRRINAYAEEMISKGRRIFRFYTFVSEAY